MSKRSQLMIALTKDISNLCKSIKYKNKINRNINFT